VGSFLYGVAYRTALEAKAVNARRLSREKQVEVMPQPEVLPGEPQDWRLWLDHELNLLPEAYRAVIVACDLEGRSRKEAARLLGLAEGTVSSRLARGRCLLAKRLSRYGLSLSGGVLAVALSEGATSAVPASLASATVKIAVLVASGEFSAISTSVGILMKGAFQTMLLAKLKLAVGAVMVVIVLGASGLVYRASGQSGPAGKGGGGRPATELDVLKQEVELLKLKLEVVEQKLRAQNDELRALRADVRGGGNKEAGRVAESLAEVIQKRQADVEALREADRKDLESRKRKDLEAERDLRTLLDQATHQMTERNRELLEQLRKSDPLQEAEAALKPLREARDTEAQRKAADALEKALKRLREQQKKPDRPER
jgi:hypothetical protein